MSGPRITEDSKPDMMTEAARSIAVPSWWKGGTTVSAAQAVADRLKEARQ